MFTFSELAIKDPSDLRMGFAPRPLTTRDGLVIGGGQVYPELNFTLPVMPVNAQTMPEVLRQYREMATATVKRAVELEAPGLVLEFETLPPMTENPDWGMAVVETLLEVLADHRQRHGLRSVLRMTPNDTREMERPPRMREGALWDNMLEVFERSAQAGAGLLSIESVGGKEVHDEALQLGDIGQIVFALCVMGVRDMRMLWTRIAQIASDNGSIAAGDTACGFANTAMVLAEQRLIPRVLAAVVRCISAVRSLVAYECGAVGPGKDCGYENVFLKVITGYPMAMEGKTAACAHLSPVGNVAAAACDTWSNESVQNVRLLGASAPVCSLEMLVYDCRLFNAAIQEGPEAAASLQRWCAASDAGLDPQAYILTPASAVQIARAIVQAPDHYRAGVAAGLAAVDLLTDAAQAGQVKILEREAPWLERMRHDLEALPDTEEGLIAEVMPQLDQTMFRAQDYDLE